MRVIGSISVLDFLQWMDDPAHRDGRGDTNVPLKQNDRVTGYLCVTRQPRGYHINLSWPGKLDYHRVFDVTVVGTDGSRPMSFATHRGVISWSFMDYSRLAICGPMPCDLVVADHNAN